ncbi:MAG: aminotransferase class I/II-fold pyridoxal phosphate-dependent enzyme [Vicinamibacterales bacterium]|jgi:aspartate/methionine/tyrosine aminotransferase|nr:aminotransferase [Acidobacteriota bacterium]MDP7210774.1 aminotransferase class I/II-fold pyridoxal phosphate-dependent enzyme [Vicinamibacterales bacterium]HJO17100.1 aminotransferase class I/II-fold pyridoxal phosphate-dependent enzyme [Vicinamibacterales bacterium]|tara:strand:- start:27923 stop:29047 length:1125 start_codon:yes stop_codon:yes gene_type:complete
MSKFQPFVMERLLSKWENQVEYNLSESGVHPATVRELIPDPEQVEQLLSTEIVYSQANGIPELRERIAALYPGATSENVLVTVGCIEANLLSLQTLAEPGDEIAVMAPNYLQVWGAAQNLGMVVRTFDLSSDRKWELDVDSLSQAVTDRTKLIAVCNPNNPTGHIMSSAEMDAVVTAADRVGAWILADEVYSGAERLTDEQTPSFWGRYDKVFANNSLSKACGLPGLRVGWIVGPPTEVDEAWARHEYLTISVATLSNQLAAVALSPEMRPKLLQRTRDYIRRGYKIFEEWMQSQGNLLSIVPPGAAAIAFPHYELEVNSTTFVERLIKEKSVLVAPGDHFNVDRHLRISFGLPAEYLRGGLERIHQLLTEMTN